MSVERRAGVSPPYVSLDGVDDAAAEPCQSFRDQSRIHGKILNALARKSYPLNLPEKRCGLATEVFLDETHVDAGADFEEEILHWLERTDELVALLTPWALERPYVWSELGAVWGRRKPIIALLLGLTSNDLQSRPGTPQYLKKRNLLALNDVGKYFDQLRARVQEHANGASNG